jgi:hypothetical protein
MAPVKPHRKCNPTVKTLERIGEVLGKELVISWRQARPNACVIRQGKPRGWGKAGSNNRELGVRRFKARLDSLREEQERPATSDLEKNRIRLMENTETPLSLARMGNQNKGDFPSWNSIATFDSHKCPQLPL